jgi:hypothetical protein
MEHVLYTTTSTDGNDIACNINDCCNAANAAILSSLCVLLVADATKPLPEHDGSTNIPLTFEYLLSVGSTCTRYKPTPHHRYVVISKLVDM